MEVGEDREQIEEAGQHVASLRHPRHGLDPQRMDREDQRSDRGADYDRAMIPESRRGEVVPRPTFSLIPPTVSTTKSHTL